MIGLLAIAKSGGTYLALDPIFPGPRLEQIIDDAKPLLIITNASQLSKLPVNRGAVLLMDDTSSWAYESTENINIADPSSQGIHPLHFRINRQT